VFCFQEIFFVCYNMAYSELHALLDSAKQLTGLTEVMQTLDSIITADTTGVVSSLFYALLVIIENHIFIRGYATRENIAFYDHS